MCSGVDTTGQEDQLAGYGHKPDEIQGRGREHEENKWIQEVLKR